MSNLLSSTTWLTREIENGRYPPDEPTGSHVSICVHELLCQVEPTRPGRSDPSQIHSVSSWSRSPAASMGSMTLNHACSGSVP
jgi:hypothetical protein